MDFNVILTSAIQSVREISAVIVTDDYRYLCYKEQKSPYNFFHILIFTNYLRLKLRTNGNIERRVVLFCSEGHQPLVYAVIQITLLSLQRCPDFQTRKLACNAI